MKLLNTKEVAQVLGVSEREVRRKCEQKIIKAQKLYQRGNWIVRSSDLEKYLKIRA